MTLKFELRHSQHAIGEFSAVMEFQRNLRQDEFGPVQQALAEIADRLELPASPTVQLIRIGPPMPGLDELAKPIARQRFAPDGTPGVALTCDENTVTYSTRQYTRWQDLWPVLRDAFADLASAYLPAGEAIKIIRLQYLNEYSATESHEDGATEIFRPGSRWIADAAANAPNYWHSHSGLFIQGEAGVRHLINVNADVLEAQFAPGSAPRAFVKVVVLTSCHYDRIGGLTSTDDLMQRLERDLNTAHRLERQTLAEVIADEYLEVMGALNSDY